MSRKSFFVKLMDFLGIRPFFYIFAIFFYGTLLIGASAGISTLSTISDYISFIMQLVFYLIVVTIFLRVGQWGNYKIGNEDRFNRMVDSLFKSNASDKSKLSNSDEKSK